MPIKLLLTISNREVTQLFVFIVFIVAVYIFYVTIRVVGIGILKYIGARVNTVIKYFALVIHMSSSLICALLLPNNVLVTFPFFENLYKNGIWIPISMVLLLFLHLILIGWILSALFLFIDNLKSNFFNYRK